MLSLLEKRRNLRHFSQGAAVTVLVLCAAIALAQEAQRNLVDIAEAEKRALNGDVSAMVQLGKTYWGQTAIRDVEKGRLWLERAAEKGSLDAQMLLAASYFAGIYVSKDRAKAAQYFLQVSQREDIGETNQATQALARYYLGMMHLGGEGVERSIGMAVKFLEAAAQQGSSPAQYDLAVMYSDGKGIEVNKARACDLYEKAAAQGHAQALNNAGYCFDSGVGRTRDIERAKSYYARSAEAGNTKAQGNLAILYGNSQEWGKSYFWLRVAESLGSAQNRPAIERAKAHLTSSQVDALEKEVTEWLTNHKGKAEP